MKLGTALLLIGCMAINGLMSHAIHAAELDVSKIEPTVLAQARALIEQKDYETAKELLRAENLKNPNNADTLNLLGYLCRLTDQLGDAATFYAKALEIEPHHKGALEYQGELYLMLDRPQKAKVNLDLLGELCGQDCEEYQDLAEALAEYEAPS